MAPTPAAWQNGDQLQVKTDLYVSLKAAAVHACVSYIAESEASATCTALGGTSPPTAMT